jgi:hypothetical protein
MTETVNVSILAIVRYGAGHIQRPISKERPPPHSAPLPSGQNGSGGEQEEDVQPCRERRRQKSDNGMLCQFERRDFVGTS